MIRTDSISITHLIYCDKMARHANAFDIKLPVKIPFK